MMTSHRAKDTFDLIINAAIRLMVGVAVFVLFLHSIFSTSFIGVGTDANGAFIEKTLNIRDYPLRHLVSFVCFFLVLLLLKKLHGRMTARYPKYAAFMNNPGRILKALLPVWFAAGCLWILTTQLVPASDPVKVYTIAMQWREQNFSSFAEGGYLFRYPFQSGIVLFYYLWTFVFGMDNYVGFQLINAAAVVLIYFFLTRLAGWIWREDKRIEPAVCIGLMLWIPFSFYITYLYGILIGMACSMGAFYMMVKYLETRKYRYMVIAAFAIGVATVLKTNCLIYAVAMVCFLIYDTIVTNKKDKIKSVVFIILILFGISGCKQATDRYVEHLSGYEMPEGEVMVSWIVMGLQDSDFAPGTYSGYIATIFERYHYDAAKITEASVADIRKILKRMAENPLDEALPFFASKTAFQWNDPSFVGMQISDNRSSAVTVPAWAQSMINGNGRILLSVVFNYIQTLIWIGILLYLFIRRKSRNIYELIGPVIFLGGYLFHLFWESSSSYTLPYFVVMIPYAVKGYLDLARGTDAFVQHCRERKEEGKMFAGQQVKSQLLPFFACAVLMVLVAAFSRTNLFKRTIGLDDGPDAREQFYGRNRAWSYMGDVAAVSQYHLISPYLDETHALVQNEGIIGTEEKTSGREQQILVRTDDGVSTFRFADTGEVLAVSGGADMPVSYMDDAMNMYYEDNPAMQVQWVIQPADGGGYYILSDESALTWQDGRVLVTTFERTDGQKWLLD